MLKNNTTAFTVNQVHVQK